MNNSFDDFISYRRQGGFEVAKQKKYCISNSTIKVIFGIILNSQAEVIVNSSGSKMTMGGG